MHLECKRHETVFSTAVEHFKQGSVYFVARWGWQQQKAW